ncbi:hypothetical protein ACP70R_049009 [Stipagrostis hirtigluma subsp. patula]
MARRASAERSQKAIPPDEKIEVHHLKLMKSFQSILSGELWFMCPTMAGITFADRMDKANQATIVLIFLVIGYISILTWILSHSTEARRWSRVVSALTELVTIFCLGLFNFAVGLFTPSEYDDLVLVKCAAVPFWWHSDCITMEDIFSTTS